MPPRAEHVEEGRGLDLGGAQEVRVRPEGAVEEGGPEGEGFAREAALQGHEGGPVFLGRCAGPGVEEGLQGFGEVFFEFVVARAVDGCAGFYRCCCCCCCFRQICGSVRVVPGQRCTEVEAERVDGCVAGGEVVRVVAIGE